MVSLVAMLTIGHFNLQNDPERDTLVAKAMASAREAVAKVKEDPNRPLYHYRAPAQWMNDPNGPIYSGGWYHVFYQFNPYGDRWGNMHWGHSRSRDLVNWEDLPVALWPSKSKGEEHVYSGSCFPGPDGPIAFYTSIGASRPSEQWAAIPEDKDLLKWRKAPLNPILKSDLKEWRDPFVFYHKGANYMLVGGGKDGRGIVALYKAKDKTLMQWEDQGILFTHPDQDVANIECPNITKIGKDWALFISVHSRVEVFVGDLDAKMSLQTRTRSLLNLGSYASQIVQGTKGRVVQMAWVPLDTHSGWNGCLTLPGVLNIKDGYVYRQPIPELKALRASKVSVPATEFEGELDLSSQVSGDLLEIEGKIDFQSAKRARICLRRSTDGARGVQLEFLNERHGVQSFHMFLDRGLVEDFTDLGRTVKFSADPADLGLSFKAEGGKAKLHSLTVYKLRPAKFDLSRYK